MSASTAFVSIFHAIQACLSAVTGLLSYSAITKLQQYEKPSEKAAKFSSTAEHELHKTRTTQTSGALATLSSLGSAIYLTVASSHSAATPFFVCALNTVGLALAHQHLSGYWTDKAKIPFVTDHNAAVNTSNQMRQLLGGLAISWGLVTLYYLVKFF